MLDPDRRTAINDNTETFTLVVRHLWKKPEIVSFYCRLLLCGGQGPALQWVKFNGR